MSPLRSTPPLSTGLPAALVGSAVGFLAVARLTRLITTDWLGEWVVVRRVKQWASKHETAEIEMRTDILRRKREHAEQSAGYYFGGLQRTVGVGTVDSEGKATIHLHTMVHHDSDTKPALDDPITSWAQDEAILPYDENDPFTWQAKLAKGLDCPFCVGFWIGLLVLIGGATIGRLPVLRHLWALAMGALALNYVVGHVSSRIDQ